MRKADTRTARRPKAPNAAYWSGRVTRESHALELEAGVFTWDDPKRIAESLKRSADASSERKAPPFRSAMSMLVFYVNRAGTQLDRRQRRVLDAAKEELRRLYGKNKTAKVMRPRASRTRVPAISRRRRGS